MAPEYLFVRYMGPKFAIVFSGIEKQAVLGFMEEIKKQVEEIEIEPVDVEFDYEEGEEEIIARPKINVIISTYYKGTALEGVLKRLEEYLDNADKKQNEIVELWNKGDGAFVSKMKQEGHTYGYVLKKKDGEFD